MTRQQRKVIENHFYHYERERNECAEYIADRAISGVDYSGEHVRGSAGNNVEKKVIDTVDGHMVLYKWCLVFEKTFERFKWTQKDKLMTMRYLDNNHDVCICNEIGISRSTYFYWVEEILQVAFLWAQEYGIM